MHKWLYGTALAALVVGVIDIQAPVGSRSATEGGFLLLLSMALAVVATVVWRRGIKRCPACAETVKRQAVRCRHCGADLV